MNIEQEAVDRSKEVWQYGKSKKQELRTMSKGEKWEIV